MAGLSNLIHTINSVVVNICHLLAMLVITIGIGKALIIYLKNILSRTDTRRAIRTSRLELGHAFSLGLGFLIGASILNTTLAPSWNEIGQLGAIIAIRTALNYFLLKEITLNVLPGEEDDGRITAPELATGSNSRLHPSSIAAAEPVSDRR